MFYTDRKTRFLWAYALRSLAVVLIVGIFIRIFFLASFVMNSNAMSPSLLPQDFILALKNAPLERGQVLVYSCSENEQNYCARRLLGFPGDRIEFKQGQFILNDKPTANQAFNTEDFVAGPLVVPPLQLYVLDDNRSVTPSPGGLIPQSAVQGRAWRIWLSLEWYSGGEVRAWPEIRWSRILRRID